MYTELDFLLDSKMLNKEDGITKGAFNLSYNIKNHKFSAAHSEITGYGISMLVNINRWQEDTKYLSIAKDCIDFLIRMKETDIKDLCGAYSFGVNYGDNKKSEEFYSFDAMIIAKSFLDLYKETGEKSYLRQAEESITWLRSKCQNEDGSFKALYNSNKNIFDEQKLKGRFYDSKCALHGKYPLVALSYYELTKDNDVLESVLKNIDWTLSLQKENGSFKVNKLNNEVYMHPTCYIAEGLVFAYYMLKDEKVLKALVKLWDWISNVQNKDGSYYWLYDENEIRRKLVKRKATGPVAQAIRLLIAGYYITGKRDYLNKANMAASFIKSMYIKSDLPGAYLSSYIQIGPLKIKDPNIFSWQIMFVLQALYCLNKANNNESNLSELMKELN